MFSCVLRQCSTGNKLETGAIGFHFQAIAVNEFGGFGHDGHLLRVHDEHREGMPLVDRGEEFGHNGVELLVEHLMGDGAGFPRRDPKDFVASPVFRGQEV